MPPRRSRKPRAPESPIPNPVLKLASTPSEREKEKSISTLWYNNLKSYPTRTMFDDIPLDYRINAFIHGTRKRILGPFYTVPGCVSPADALSPGRPVPNAALEQRLSP